MTRLSRKLLVLVAVFAILVAGGLLHVSLRLQVIRLGYEYARLTRERRALEEQRARLLLEQSLLRNPERIEHLAREKLGMVRPDPADIRVVRP